jgi:Protein of unknown function (DUF3489)
MNSPAKLTDAQLVILSAASQREDLRVIMPDKLRSDGGINLLATLTKKGVIEIIPEGGEIRRSTDADSAGLTNYRVSPFGLARIGVAAVEAVEVVANPTIASPPLRRRALQDDRDSIKDVPSATQGVDQPAAEIDGAPSTANMIGGHPLNASGPAGSDIPQPNAPAPTSDAGNTGGSRRAPRAGSKLDQVIVLLSADTGATLDDLIRVTSWLPHTARAALTGLRHRGYDVRLERGGKGSGSVYRLAFSRAIAS